MANHDYNIANQTAPSARTDINNALAAIVSNNSGASEPTTTFANMWWYDTTNNKLKFRNEANSAWIEIGQLNQSTNAFSGGTPAGGVMAFAMSTPPDGWLACSGQAVSRTTYAALFSAIGTTYGSGDGSTTFNVPDLRGEFVRGWDNGKGTDSGRTLGSAQTDEFASHDHGLISAAFPDTFNSSQVAAGVSVSGFFGSRDFNEGGTETRPRNIALNYCIKF